MTALPETDRKWLVVGHGSVGAAIVTRLRRHGVVPAVYDPDPRIPVTGGSRIPVVAELPRVQYVVSCVPADAALAVPSCLEPAISSEAVLFDWNTLAPRVKAEVAARAPCEVVDVALLDSLDKEGPARIALSGPRAAAVLPILKSLDFDAVVVGGACGDAARLKYLRSMFMKSLEALVIEHAALSHGLDGAGVVRASIASNVGEEFLAFAHILLETNRIHATRRADELESAAELFAAGGRSTSLAKEAIGVLRRTAEIWNRQDAPPPDAGYDVLVAYLAQTMR